MDIEVFLATFPTNRRIMDASIELMVSILKAVEDTIGFFITHQGWFVPRRPHLVAVIKAIFT